MTNRDNSSVLAGCYGELSSGMNEAGCRLYLRPRANSPDKAGKPQSGEMRVLCTEACTKIIYLAAGRRSAGPDAITRCVPAISIRAPDYWVIEVIRSVHRRQLTSTTAKDFSGLIAEMHGGEERRAGILP